MKKLRLDWKKQGGKQLLVMEQHGHPLHSNVRNCQWRQRPAAHWANRCQWVGHGWLRMRVFQRCHGASDHDWPIRKSDPSRLVAAERLNRRMACFPWQSWDTM